MSKEVVDGDIISSDSEDKQELTLDEKFGFALTKLDEEEFLQVAAQVRGLIISEYKNPSVEVSDCKLTINDAEFVSTLTNFALILSRELSKRLAEEASQMEVTIGRNYNMKAEISNISDEIDSVSENCIKELASLENLPELSTLILEVFKAVKCQIFLINKTVDRQIEKTKKKCEFLKNFPTIIEPYSQGNDISEYIEETTPDGSGDGVFGGRSTSSASMSGNEEAGRAGIAGNFVEKGQTVPELEGDIEENIKLKESLSRLSDEEFLESLPDNEQLEKDNTVKIFYNEFCRRFEEIGLAVKAIMGISTTIDHHKESMTSKIKHLADLSQGLDDLSLSIKGLEIEFQMQIKEIENGINKSALPYLKGRLHMLNQGFPVELSEYAEEIHKPSSLKDEFVMVEVPEDCIVATGEVDQSLVD